MIENKLLTQLIFWGVWLVIPMMWEIIGAAGAATVIALKYARGRWVSFRGTKRRAADSVSAADNFYPTVSIIVPVFNSEDTLETCLQSIVEQEYLLDKLEVLLVDNGSSDGSRAVFQRFQSEYGELRLWWHTSEQGKSRALNMGVFSGTGRYVVNIDSDGRLDRFAIANIVQRFEENDRIVAMSGVVLTDVEQITANHATVHERILKLVRQCELFEYCESFLVGRSFQSIFNKLNTMAGAFSCFKREALIKTQLYNTETMGEDAHMTSQVREFSGGRVELCENAFYFTQPLENLDKLYTQRQRWQRAELEVAGLFSENHLGNIFTFLKKPDMRRLVSSHTLAFPRLIWLFAMLYLYFINYPLELLVGANALLYASYIVLGFLNISVSCLYLGNQRKVRSYLLRHMYICLVLPFYRFMLYWIRMAGIINSLTTPSKWRTRTFTEEVDGARREAGKVVRRRFGFMYILKRMINGQTNDI